MCIRDSERGLAGPRPLSRGARGPRPSKGRGPAGHDLAGGNRQHGARRVRGPGRKPLRRRGPARRAS
eukprot:5983364-Alexandrium_andersonii.AAC.1